MKSVGEQLKLARLHKHWTPQAAAKATKIKMEQLLDLENNNFSKFASPAYARGFVSIYARTLGLEERKILSQLDGTIGTEEDEGVFISAPSVEYIPEQVQVTAPVAAGRFGQKVIYLFGLFFAFIVLLILVRAYQAGVVTRPQLTAKPPADQVVVAKSDHPPEKEAPKATPVEQVVAKAIPVEPAGKTSDVGTVKPGDAQVAPAATAVSTDHELTLQANEKSSWVRVSTVEDGHEKQLFEGVLEAGKSKSFEAQKFNLKIANPAVVDVIFDSVNYGPYSDSDSPETFTLPNVAQND